jgi:hypothetical protein
VSYVSVPDEAQAKMNLGEYGETHVDKKDSSAAASTQRRGLDWMDGYMVSGYHNGVNYRRTLPTISRDNYQRTSPIISWNLPINNYMRLPRLSLGRPVILEHSQSPESTSNQERSMSLEPSQVQNHPEESRSRSSTRLEYIRVGSQRRTDGISTW